MPTYIALRKTWLGHENRMVQENEQFTTQFPKVKLADGTEVDMKLGENLQLVAEEKAATRTRRGSAVAEQADEDIV